MSMMASITSLFDSVCFAYGEKDAVVGSQCLCYAELQYSSNAVARQLLYRYKPTYVLLDLRGQVAAEIVATLACIRIGVPFVPVSTEERHAGNRLKNIVNTLRKAQSPSTPGDIPRIVAIARCDDDKDPIIDLFSNAHVYMVVYVNRNGDLLEPMDVPESLPDCVTNSSNDDLYVLFTSGTSSDEPKAVVGSHSSTLHRLRWFAEKFPSDENTVVARRTKLTFVDGITELFSAILFPPAVLHAFDPEELALNGISMVLSSPNISQVTMLPSQLTQLMISSPPANHALSVVIVSGEMCPPSLLPAFQKHFPTTKLVNLYGQTESTGDVTCAVLTDMEKPIEDNVVAVGYPIRGITITLADNNELVVSGNLSNGYLHSQCFTNFHTGDIGYCIGGCWFVKGRVNDVQKVNGILTSPSEVEAAFLQVYPNILCAAVILDDVFMLVEGDIDFCREDMRAAGVPWNLIPKTVFKCIIPRMTSGACKVNRKEVKNLVTKITSGSNQGHINHPDAFIDTLLHVLNTPYINEQSSFVDLGGDSATAITFLYRLKVIGYGRCDVTAKDILNSDSILELRAIINGDTFPKKRKIEKLTNEMKPFIKEINAFDGHIAVDFLACVDSAPLKNQNNIYAVCQGGIIQRVVNCKSIVASFDVGTSVQAGMIIVDEVLVVCGYNSDEDSWTVIALQLDLSKVLWRKKMKGQIKSTPVKVDSSIYVVSGCSLHLINPIDGSEISKPLELPATTESKPAIVSSRNTSTIVVYAFSDWDVGLAVIQSGTITFVSGVSSPVYADLLTIERHRVVVMDIAGFMHVLNVRTKKITSSAKVTSKPIFSGPVVSKGGQVVFGCHDGLVRCINTDSIDDADVVTLWEYNASAVIYSNPVWLHDNGHAGNDVVVCTTAGDIVRINGINGKLKWKTTLNAEIWSSPIVIDEVLKGNVIAVGSRDSKLHILEID